jgi:hypothetical protein
MAPSDAVHAHCCRPRTALAIAIVRQGRLMRMKGWIIVAASLAALRVNAQSAPDPAKPASPLAVGQEWSFAGGPQSEATPKLVIDRIETDDTGAVVVHVSILDMPRLGSMQPARVKNDVPFYEGALRPTLRQLLATGVAPPPGFAADYQAWRGDRRHWVHDESLEAYYEQEAAVAQQYRLQNPE